MINGISSPYPAPKIDGISAWINSWVYEALAFNKPESDILELIVPRDEVEFFTFTFGNK